MAEAERGKVAGCAYVLYYIVLFFAFWFGSRRFDVDGDGDFDPEDVQAYLADKGFLKKNFKTSTTRKLREKRQRKKRASFGSDEDEGPKDQQAAEQEVPPQPREQPEDQQQQEDPQEQPQDDGEGGKKSEINSTFAVALFDNDGDGAVDLDDAFDSKVEGDAAEDEMLESLNQSAPWFIVFECVTTVGLWLVFAIKKSMEESGNMLTLKAGLDSFADAQTDLRVAGPDCEDYRTQAWRWFTYQWTHVGAMHVSMNCFLNIMLGVPLEGMHGHLRLAIMFNIGVFGGACSYFVNDSHTAVVGCSGGCYALIGIHLADLIMNWRQKRFRIPTLVFLIFIAGADIGSYMMAISPEHASQSAHVGGSIAGLIIGILLVRNMKVVICERILQVVLFIIGAGLIGGCLAFLFMQEAGPRNLWEQLEDQPGWCWLRQVWTPDINEFGWECVRCGTRACMDEWTSTENRTSAYYLSDVKLSACDQQGWYYDGR